jgi:hypothetical protein
MDQSTRTNSDEHHLRTLAVCFYVLGSLSALSGCILMGFALLGVAIMTGGINAGPEEVAVFLGLLLTIVELVLALFVWTMSLLELLTSRSLASHSRYRLCIVIACIELLNFPFGTTLAIFTLIVLQRPSVRDLFAGIPDRARRLEAFPEFGDDEDGQPPSPRKGPDDGTIREGMPN